MEIADQLNLEEEMKDQNLNKDMENQRLGQGRRDKELLARIKQLEIDKDQIASERDKLLLKHQFVLDEFAKWWKGQDTPLEMIKDPVDKFMKGIENLKK